MWFVIKSSTEVTITEPMEAHETTLHIFTDLWLLAFFESCKRVYDALIADFSNLKCVLHSGSHEEIKTAHQDLNITIESINRDKKLAEFDKENEQQPMFANYRGYIRQVMTLLAFQWSIIDKHLFLYLALLERLSTYFFTFNRLDYAQNILEFVARSYESKETEPEIWISLLRGDFA
ncbi:hypothetical protein DPMN_044869 [Dreissena polymorpha]|uniref:Uncharacterized protein n=1 Tax=Dreissena polymorpha TaxID=45954 RepID=A0A9D4D4X6_DREPO|nr:hypothetical protein DPMN_044869 [Dreissena polymorpha]